MNSYDLLYQNIIKVLTHKQLNLPIFKKYTFRNFVCCDIFVTLPNKKKIWEKWVFNIPSGEIKRHCIFYKKENKLFTTYLINNK